jgi:poly(A) polymerase
MMKLSADWLRAPDAVKVMNALQAQGNLAFFVGGCVRNGLLNVPCTDIDISTDARPEQTIALAKAAGLKPVPTGIDHGTITIIADGEPFEVTSFRKDVETDGRRAVVAFSDDIMDDARRRDFTMNAIYARADGEIVDPLNGLPDLQARHVRFIEDPDQRIAEDYLRILRFFRFTAQYGDPALGIDGDGLAACAAGIDGLDTLAKERIGAEMRKILGCENPAMVISAMDASGILPRILTSASAKFIAILVHIEQSFQIDWMTRLIVLGGTDQVNALRLTKAEGGKLRAILRMIEMGIRPSAAAFEYGEEVARAGALAMAALCESVPPADLESAIKRGMAATFPVQSQDLAPLTGKALGDALRETRARWVASEFELTKEELLS